MVVVRLGARVPLKSLIPSRSSLTTRRVTKTRINLFGATKKDSVTNLRLAKSILQSSASAFMSRWNFDPITEIPLAKGRFSWTPFNANDKSAPVENAFRISEEETMHKSEFPSEQIDNSWRPSAEDRMTEEDRESILPACPNISPLINNLNLNREDTVDKDRDATHQLAQTSQSRIEPPKRKLRQSKITEFGKIVKRRPRNTLCKTPISRRLM